MIINGILFEKALIERLYRCCNSNYGKVEEDIESGRLKAIADKDGKIFVRFYDYDLENGNDMAICEDGTLIRNEEKIQEIFG